MALAPALLKKPITPVPAPAPVAPPAVSSTGLIYNPATGQYQAPPAPAPIPQTGIKSAPTPAPTPSAAPAPYVPKTGQAGVVASAAGAPVYPTGQSVLDFFASKLTTAQKFQNIRGVVRIAGNPTAITIGTGGGLISTPEELLSKGFSEGDVQEITPEVAQQLGINVKDVYARTGPERTAADTQKTKEATTSGDQGAVQGEITGINDKANADAQAEADAISATTTKVDLSGSTKLVEKITKMLDDQANAPAPTSMKTEYLNERAKLNVGGLETELAGLDAEIAKLDADFSTSEEGLEQRQVSMGQIRRRQTATSIQYQREKRDLVVERNGVANQLNMKYGVLDTMVKLADMDIDNAREAYNTKFNQAIALTNLIRGIDNDAKTDADRKADNARAMLTVQIDLLKSGNIDYASLDASQKANITALEIAAGYPVGTTQFIHATIKDPIISVAGSYVGTDGYKYTQIMTKKADGSTSFVEMRSENKEKGPAGPGATEAQRDYAWAGGEAATGMTPAEWITRKDDDDKLTEPENLRDVTSKLATYLNKNTGTKDDYVSPETYKQGKNAWITDGYSGEDFDKSFKSFVNPDHYKDYGFSAAKWRE